MQLRSRALSPPRGTTSQACLMPHLHVPPVTSVNRACIVADPNRAARSALASLDHIRDVRYGGAANEPACIRPAEGEVRKGVVKLGFAWEAAHVRLFRGEKQLALALHGLATEQGSEACHVYVQVHSRYTAVTTVTTVTICTVPTDDTSTCRIFAATSSRCACSSCAARWLTSSTPTFRTSTCAATCRYILWHAVTCRA